MNGRAVALIIGLAALGGVVYAATWRDTSGDGVDVPEGEPAGDWGPMPYVEDFVNVIDGIVMNTSNKLSDTSRDALKQFEGFSATPYFDYKGNSIGYGHLIKPGEDLTYVTPDQADALLIGDVGWAEEAVTRYVRVNLTQGQFDALVMFTFGCGAGAFQRSTLLRKLNSGDYGGAAAEFGRWINAGGKPLASLQRRRAFERELFVGGA